MNLENRIFAIRLSKQAEFVISLIADKFNLSEMDAIDKFYSSKMYALLSNEKTKLWHNSPHALFEIYKCEIETGEPRNSVYVLWE